MSRSTRSQHFTGQPFRSFEGLHNAVDPVQEARAHSRALSPGLPGATRCRRCFRGQGPEAKARGEGPGEKPARRPDPARRSLPPSSRPGFRSRRDNDPQSFSQAANWLCICPAQYAALRSRDVPMPRAISANSLTPRSARRSSSQCVRDTIRRRFPRAQQLIQDMGIDAGTTFFSGGLSQDFVRCPADPAKVLHVQKRRLHQRLKPPVQRPQGAKQISAIHGGNVARFERRQCLNVVPIEQMALMALQFANRLHRPRQLLRQLHPRLSSRNHGR